MIDIDRDKRVVGLLGEMNIAMVLHERGWQVYRPVVDENIDFVLTRYYCKSCGEFHKLFVRQEMYSGKKKKTITNLCEKCQKPTLQNIVRFIQVKTSDGVWDPNSKVGKFSFHAKLRHHVDPRTFYIWIAVHQGERIDKKTLCYYIFHHNDVQRFDDLDLASYQITDNQKTTLRINNECEVKNIGTRHSYDCFKGFVDNFDVLDKIDSEVDGV